MSFCTQFVLCSCYIIFFLGCIYLIHWVLVCLRTQNASGPFLYELQGEPSNFTEDDPAVWCCQICLEILVLPNGGSCRHTKHAFNDSIIIIYLDED